MLEQTYSESRGVASRDDSQFDGIKAWLVCMTAALFFFYEFIQFNMFGVIYHELRNFLHLTAGDYGMLCSVYLVANVVFLFPAGYLLDRYSTKRLILMSMALSVLGTFLFSMVETLQAAYIARFLTGIGSAFCFVGCIRLASRWFRDRHLALVTGCIVTFAMVGGFVAQSPMVWLVDAYGWRGALFWDGALGSILLVAIMLLVSDGPSDHEEQEASYAIPMSDVLATYLKPKNWLMAIYTSTMNMPFAVFGAVFGIPFLMHVYHFDKAQASFINGMLFLGMIIGSPLLGWLSDTLRMRRRLMAIGAGVSVILLFMLLVLPQISFIPDVDMKFFIMIFFLMGFFSANQVLSYAVVAEDNPPELTATAVSIISICTQGGGALYQPLYGYLLEWYGASLQHGHIHASPEAYQFATLIFPVGFLVAFLAAFLSMRK